MGKILGIAVAMFLLADVSLAASSHRHHSHHHGHHHSHHHHAAHH